ncbi:MAG: RnfABCDGE type electron transport complex subunit D [Pseudomonadales bacterium]
MASTSRIMLQVFTALMPGAIVLTWFFGPGIAVNLAVAVAACLAFEAIALLARQCPLTTMLDGSAVVTGALLGLALPPFLPLWMVVVGCLFAVVFAKHLYGGLGQNLFNPAMAGYAVMIIAFPLAMSVWPSPASPGSGSINLLDVLLIKLGAPVADAVTMATPLDTFKFRGTMTVNEIWSRENGFGSVSGVGWQWVNLAFLLGGIYLITIRACGWLAPAAMLASLIVLPGIFYDGGSSESLGSPLFHLFGGATMMAAFFIVTDPVTSPSNPQGQIVFGLGVGAITFLIRSTGAYPEGIAFAILLMNAASPLIDHLQWRAT